MEDRLDNVEKIMEKYNDFKDSLEPKVSEELEADIIGKKNELEREEKILEAFKEELNSLDTASMDYVQMHVTIGNYNRYILESKQKVDILKKEYEEKLNEKNKIENPDYTLDQKRKIKSKTYEARDIAKKDLIAEQKEIEADIEEQELELKTKELKLKNFKLEYEEQEQSWEERDENGDLVTVTKKVNVPQNANERRKLYDSIHEVTDNLTKLKEAQIQCQKYLSEIDEEYEKDVEETNEIIGNKTKKEKTETIETEEPKKEEPKKEEPELQKAKSSIFEEVFPINFDAVNVVLDVKEGTAKMERKVSKDSTINVSLDLEKLMNSKNQRQIRRDVINRFKESGEGKYTRMVRRLNRKINPAVLALALEEDNSLDIIRKYIDAVKIGDKEALPFKYNVNLDGERNISDKAFAKLNRYAVRDNKNLGTNFNAVEWYSVKNVLNKILPGKMRLGDRKTKLLSAPEKIKNIGNQTKEKAVGLGKNVAEEIQVAGIKMAGYMNGENQHLTDMKVKDARNSFVPKAKADEKLAVEKCNKEKNSEEKEIEEEIKE